MGSCAANSLTSRVKNCGPSGKNILDLVLLLNYHQIVQIRRIGCK